MGLLYRLEAETVLLETCLDLGALMGHLLETVGLILGELDNELTFKRVFFDYSR